MRSLDTLTTVGSWIKAQYWRLERRIDSRLIPQCRVSRPLVFDFDGVLSLKVNQRLDIIA